MDKQPILQSLFSDIPGVVKAYFQEPSSDKMVYPCIVYKHDKLATKYASNLPYNHTKGYSVTVITRDPGSDISDIVAEFPLCRFSRRFTEDQLHHTVFTLYF